MLVFKMESTAISIVSCKRIHVNKLLTSYDTKNSFVEFDKGMIPRVIVTYSYRFRNSLKHIANWYLYALIEEIMDLNSGLPTPFCNL